MLFEGGRFCGAAVHTNRVCQRSRELSFSRTFLRDGVYEVEWSNEPAGADCVATGKSHTASSGTALSAIYQAVLKVRSSAEVTRSPDGVTQSPHAPLAGAKRNQLVSAPTDSEIRGYCVTQWHKSSPRSKTTRRELVCVKRCSC